MTNPNPIAVLDLVDNVLARDEVLSEELAVDFLAIFPWDVQVELLAEALLVTEILFRENSCPAITASAPIGSSV